MSRVIKVEDQIYNELDQLRTGRQTFSDVIKSLLLSRLKILVMMGALEDQLGFRDWQRQELEKLQKKEEG